VNPSLFRALMQRAAAPSESDAELLGQFAATRDEPAFAELVRRYAGLVWGQCRHLLPNEADAEDAFQATFLALARRPGAVRTAVGPYLHGVAYRVCQNARRLAGRRKKHEVASATSEATHPVADSAWDAALAAVYAEVHRLPEPQRVAFVLCVLEGRGLTDAAAELGVKLGTLSARLSRAKRVVMDRLAARGIIAGMAAVSALAPVGATAAVVDKAVQTAVGAAVVPAMVQSLTHGVTNMAAFKLKALAAGVLLGCGLTLGVGSGWVANAQDRGEKGPPKPLKQEVPKWSPLDDELLAWPISEEEQRSFDEAKRRMAEAEKLIGVAVRLREQAEREKAEKSRPEFQYVPLPDGHIGAADFEKLVKARDANGYTFVGCVPMKGFEPQKVAVVQTLVFRKSAPTLAAKVPEKAKWVRIDLGPAGAKGHEELFKAITTLAIRKYGGKANAPQMLFSGEEFQFWGDPEAIRWMTELVENSKK